MITNDLQYRNTKAHLRQFELAEANLSQNSEETPSRLTQLELDAVRSQADDLRIEIEEYERLRAGLVSTFEAASLAEVATLLIKARIARGWTQRNLADEIHVAEQQIQRYEATVYQSASLGRLCAVAAALGIEISESGRLSPALS